MTGDPISSSKTVVIIAQNIDLESQIDIVGPATDVIFITDTNEGGSIDCTNCSFTNALRLSLVVGEYLGDLNSSISEIENINLAGVLRVNSLYAPGVVGLDLVAGWVKPEGEININQAAMKSSEGGYTAVPHGSYTMGTGSIEVISGGSKWSYQSRKLKQIYNASSSTYTMDATFKAPRVAISTVSSLLFSGRVDTRTDVLGAVSYQGVTHIPQEGLTVQTLGQTGSGSKSRVELSGSLLSDNTIDIRSLGDITLRSSLKLDGFEVSVLAGKKLLNEADLKGASISLAGDEVANEGAIDASVLAKLWARKDLSNQYGGVIRAKDIYLDSETSVVRNGSRTPYRTESANRNNLLQLDNSEILYNLDRYASFDPSTINSADLGAYYLLPRSLVLINDSALSMPEDHTAHVIGANIYLIRSNPKLSLASTIVLA